MNSVGSHTGNGPAERPNVSKGSHSQTDKIDKEKINLAQVFHPSIKDDRDKEKGKVSVAEVIKRQKDKEEEKDQRDKSDTVSKSRVKESLLLDNFHIKSRKEEPRRQTLHRALLDFNRETHHHIASSREQHHRNRASRVSGTSGNGS